MTPLFVRLFTLIAIFASVFLISQFGLGQILDRRAERSAVNRRLTLLRSGISHDDVNLTLLKNAPPVLPPDAGPLLRMQVSFQRLVMMSAIPFETRKVATGMAIGFCLLTGVILLFAMGSRFILTPGVVMLIAVIAASVSFGLPVLIVSRLAQRRQKLMVEQFPIALDIFTRSLRAGHPIASAIFLVTEEMSDPIGSEFGLVSDEISYGAELTDALLAMADRWNLEDMRMFVVAVSVQSETGGNLAEILENLSNVIRARASMFMKVRALSSEGRMTAWMLTVLPILTLLSMFAVNAPFYLDVAEDPIFLIGFTGLILMYAIGVYVIRRMVDLKV
jgi:tight adherence protein B